MVDSTGHTKEKVIEKLSKEMLLELYDGDDIKEDYINLRKRLSDPELSNKDFATLLKLVWDFTIAKPSMGVDLKSSKPLSNITFKFEEDNGEDNKDNNETETSTPDSRG